ncbi:MAG: hypothetical protein GWO16_14145 [Gammaproteobacteria bacterium]|nr:hypothetical protein [Gammaproteobacteria bacterium]NIR99070.1 hypothetical protein [Gammaproteobacteria bacterium]NIT64702.1 hypothetical protein [Gammaproteobacteria bacterium]NIV21660.1 hypothetical protein [Gammaproteobacteria bacterium]NIX10622.1 hypothetical protein [Gammaproteobacteria bacterium]
MCKRLIRLVPLVLALAAPPAAAGEPRDPGPAGPWPDDAELGEALRPRGEQLEFLPAPPADPVLHSHNVLHVHADSLADGWVDLEQCHTGLDPFPRAQVLYQYHEMRDLRIRSAEGIGRAWVEGQSVQIVNATRGAKLCVTGRVKILRRDAGGHFSLENGPFHRRFLDGYFPLHVTLQVRYPEDRLRFAGITPRPQAGFEVHGPPGRVEVDAWFSGKLLVKMRFVEKR